MSRLTVETDTAASAKQLAAILRKIKSVKKVTIEINSSDSSVVSEPQKPYNWTNPSRPATDEEFEQMITEAEAEEAIPAAEARKLTMKHLDKWIAVQNKK